MFSLPDRWSVDIKFYIFTSEPEDQWSCKRSNDIWAYYKFKNKFRQIRHGFKIGQGQRRVIIYINCVEIEFIMLHVKFHSNDDHKSISFVGKIFEGCYHIWAWRQSWSCELNHFIYFLSAFPRRLHITFGIDWPSGFREVISMRIQI